MMGAIAKIKAQYKNAVYLGEQPVAIQKIPSRPSTKKSHQHKRTIRAQHNNLIPRQFIEEERIVPVLHMKKSLLPTSELPLNAIDDNIATQTKEDWENKSIKPPRNSPAKRLYNKNNKNNKRNQHGNASSSANDLPMSLFVATADAPHSGIRVQAPSQEPQELVSNNTNNTQETIQTLEPPRIPTAAVPVQHFINGFDIEFRGGAAGLVGRRGAFVAMEIELCPRHHHRGIDAATLRGAHVVHV
jgi:hypothetical protein